MIRSHPSPPPSQRLRDIRARRTVSSAAEIERQKLNLKNTFPVLTTYNGVVCSLIEARGLAPGQR
jgi:hypothetical protein